MPLTPLKVVEGYLYSRRPKHTSFDCVSRMRTGTCRSAVVPVKLASSLEVCCFYTVKLRIRLDNRPAHLGRKLLALGLGRGVAPLILVGRPTNVGSVESLSLGLMLSDE